MVRELLCLAGCSDMDAERRTLEVTRLCLCALAALALLSVSLPVLYVLFVLWVIGHLALLPGIDLAGVRAASFQWFQQRWTWLRQQLRRSSPLMFLAAILCNNSAGLVRAADKPGAHGAWLTNALQTSAQRLCLVETNILGLAAKLANLEQRLEATADQVPSLKSAQGGLQQDIGGLASRLTAVEEALTVRDKAVEQEIQRGQQQLALSIRELAMEQQRFAIGQNQLPPRINTAEVALVQLQRQEQFLEQQQEVLWQWLESTRVETDRASVLGDQKTRKLAYALMGLALFCFVVLGLCAGFFHRRVQRLALETGSVREKEPLEGGLPCQEPARLSASRDAPAVAPESLAIDKRAAAASASGSGITSVVNVQEDLRSGVRVGGCPSAVPRPDEKSILGKPVPEPAELLRCMIALAQRAKGIRSKPVPGRATPWTLGCASSQGPVRPKNEDYALGFEIAGYQVLLVADGVSGEPLAGPASYLAVRLAAGSVITQLGSAWPWHRPDPTAVASQALWAAANGLSRIAADCHCVAGLKTTLIVVVAARKAYGYAYIGDGKGCILRATGMEENFLFPQRAEADAACVLAACLGPTLLGCPVTGTIPRRPGDLLIVATDGAFSESVDWSGDFSKRLLRAAFHFHGDLQRTASHVLQDLSSAKDQLGFLFDDNLSLALAGDGKPPSLAPGFWLTSQSPQEQERQSASGVCEVKSLLPAATAASAGEADQP
jgi:hypothetical protein